jgi:hypothetical protein
MVDEKMNAQYTPAWAIETYLAVREMRSARKKEFEAADKVDSDKLDLLQTYLLGVMNERGEEQIKTSAGTAFKSPQLRCTMSDRQAVIDFVMDCLEKNDPNAFDIFTNHVNKDRVKMLLDENIQPPGIEVSRFVACNVRKA